MQRRLGIEGFLTIVLIVAAYTLVVTFIRKEGGRFFGQMVEVRLANKPGTFARAAKRLGKNKVNIESAYMLGASKKSTTLGIGVKDPRAANKALGRR